jgi:hypothetical protein
MKEFSFYWLNTIQYLNYTNSACANAEHRSGQTSLPGS